jgi:hypothetical protein
VEIKIGITQVGKELTIETGQSGDDITKDLRAALAAPDGVLSLDDGNGRRVLVPAAKIGYLELGQEPHRPVGFGALAQ